MNFSLRLLARSRCLRVLSVMAWLMLVSSSLVAAPMLMGANGATQGVQTESSHQHHDMATMQQGSMLAPDLSCCNDHMVQGCNCHSLCGNLLSPVSVLAPASMSFAAVYAQVFDPTAPAPNTVPPLRPPSV